MANGWNLWVWLVSVLVRRYIYIIIIDILLIINTFPYSTCINSFLAVSSLFLCSFLNVFFCTFIYKERKNIFLNEQRSREDATKKRANTSGVGKRNNYYEDIYL